MKSNYKCASRVFDTVVCGGGIAGISAALASARNGAKTCLVEKEYLLGGLATLGLIVVYLPLCDGDGVQMSAGISEELLKLSIKYGPSNDIPQAWLDRSRPDEERVKTRYKLTYNPASMIIAVEELLISNGVTILYDARLTDADVSDGKINCITVATKSGMMDIHAKAFIDCTGDADLCCFSGEETVDDSANRRTGWYYSFDGSNMKLNMLSDPLYGKIPETSRTYSGTNADDISAHMVDMHKFIITDIEKKHEAGNTAAYPLLIPSYHGLRMTRRLAGTFEFSEAHHERVWFSDAIGMIGNWKRCSKRYSIPYRTIKGVHNSNLFAAGRCSCADKSGWDLTRVIPTCAVTGEAAGTAAAMMVKSGCEPIVSELQNLLKSNGVLLDESLFETFE